MNKGNIGFVLNHPEKTTIKTVDFIIPIASEIRGMNIVYLRQITGELRYQLLQSMQKNRYVYYDVSNSFLDTNTFTKYPATLLTGPFKPSNGDPNF